MISTVQQYNEREQAETHVFSSLPCGKTAATGRTDPIDSILALLTHEECLHCFSFPLVLPIAPSPVVVEGTTKAEATAKSDAATAKVRCMVVHAITLCVDYDRLALFLTCCTPVSRLLFLRLRELYLLLVCVTSVSRMSDK